MIKNAHGPITPLRAVEYQAALLRERKDPGFLRCLSRGLSPVTEVLRIPRGEGETDFVVASWTAWVNGLQNGETLLVSEGTVRLLEYAAASLDPELNYEMEILPFTDACVWFEEPLRFSMAHAKDGTPAQGWCDGFVVDVGIGGPADQFHSYFFMVRYDGDPRGAFREIAPMFIAATMKIGSMSRDDVQVKGWADDLFSSWGKENEYVAFNPKPLLMALWSLIGQPIISESRVRPIEPSARAARKKLKGSLGIVRVLSIRQRVRAAGAESGGSREYTHRWIVRGFWRNQPCGPGQKLRKRIWIDSYVAGPADAPLIVGGKVYRV